MIKKYNRSDLFLLVFTVLNTLFISLWLIRWIVPTLLGIPTDLVMVNSGEYKLMGLAPYGQPVYKNQILDKLVDMKSDGIFYTSGREIEHQNEI